jgi:N-acetylneuraminic acid mutarotase
MEYIQGLPVYDQDKKEWKRPPDIDKPRAAMGVESVNDTIYLIGGWESDGRTVMDTVASLNIPTLPLSS